MAQTWDRFRQAQDLAAAVAAKIQDARDLARRLIEIHDGEPFTAAADADPVPGWVLKSADGNIKGKAFTPAEYLAAVAFCRELDKLMTNQEPAAAWWNGVLSKLLTPGA